MIDLVRRRRFDWGAPTHTLKVEFVKLIGGHLDGALYEKPTTWPILVQHAKSTSLYKSMWICGREVGRSFDLDERKTVASLFAFYRYNENTPPVKSIPGGWFCVGGPLDGKLVPVNRFPFKAVQSTLKTTAKWTSENIPVPDEVCTLTTTYRPERLRAGGHLFQIALAEPLSIYNAVDMLIANYQPPR
jgi:hypothetical protein